MFYALNWFVVFCLISLWSLAAWAFHAIATWTIANAGVLAGGVGSIEALQMPVWLAPWVPPEFAPVFSAVVAAMAPSIEAMLGWAPTLAGGLSTAVWIVWGVGSFLLILLGVFATGLIAVLRRRLGTPARHSSNLAPVR
jgi:hypothetical protein